MLYMIEQNNQTILVMIAEWLKPKIHPDCSFELYHGMIQLYAKPNPKLKASYWVSLRVDDGEVLCRPYDDIPGWSIELANPQLFELIDKQLLNFYNELLQ